MKILLASAILGLVACESEPLTYIPPPPSIPIPQTRIQPVLCLYDQEAVTNQIQSLKESALRQIREARSQAMDEIQRSRQQAQKQISDAVACISKGDRWELFYGLFARYVCVHDYADANKKCTSSDDCEGKCITYGDRSQAKCEPTNQRGGCFSFIEEYPAKICYD